MSVGDLAWGPEVAFRFASIMGPKKTKARRGMHGPATEHYPWEAPAGPSGVILWLFAAVAALALPPLLWMCCAAIFQEGT